MPISPRQHYLPFILLFAIANVLGCGGSTETPAPTNPQAEPLTPPPAVTLTVQVAGDVKLAEGLRLLRGEWKALSGGELKVDSVSLAEFFAAERLDGDVVIFPSRLLGTLVERGDLRPLRATTLSSPAFGMNDIYPAIRNGEMKYGGQVFAFPLGSPPLLDFRQVKVDVAASDRGSAIPLTVVPTDGPSAAYAFILRALGHTESYRRYEALFDAADMKPRIAEPQFVRALVELTAANSGRADQPPVGFAEAMRLVGNGAGGSTLGWPSALDEQFAAAEGAAPRDVEFTAVAAPSDVYSHSRGAWEKETNPSGVVLLGVEGRLVAVTTATRNAVPAFQLAQWLTVGDLAVGLSSRSTGTLWYRASQAGASGKWLKGLEVAKEGEPVTKVVAAALATDAPVLIPRLPAIDEYLAVLADAVRTAPADEAAAQAALDGVAAKWEEITNRLGRDRQISAYRRHLGETE
ncbi:MAG: hypothetical protein C0485_07365 [Pirellula sp.]|nr:hypothetical protein [Pirellula sp.]